MSAEEMLERSDSQNDVNMTKPGDFAVRIGLLLLMPYIIYVAWYMYYAQTPNRYPFFLGGSATHDFWYMFSQLGVLEYDWLIAGFVRAVAVMLLLVSYMYLLYISFFQKSKRARRRSSKGRR